jgi:anti-sigma factor RsiW
MEADNILLMAFVDGELTPQERADVEKRIEASPEVAQRVARLRAEKLACRDAFDHQRLPPVPDSLSKKIEALVRARNADPFVVHGRKPATSTSQGAPRAAFGRGRRPRALWTWLTGAFAVGAVCGGALLQVGPLLKSELMGQGTQPQAASADVSAWVRQAASYQELYTRDTVAYMDGASQDIAKTVADIRREDGLLLRIPDLSAAGLTFKNVQRLRFNGRALVQLIYLPEKGDPVALCVMKEVRPDAALAERRVASMNVVTWRQSELGYALIGSHDGAELARIGRRIADRNVGQLFGQLAQPHLALAQDRAGHMGGHAAASNWNL